MQRRALILGAAAALAAPAVARARTWDSFGDTFTRQQRGLWLPAQDVELNPSGQLIGGLLMLLLFDDKSLRPIGIQSKVRYPMPVFSFTGTSQVLTQGPFGGRALATSGSSTDDIVAATSLLPNGTNWTFSGLIKFDGTGGGAGNLVLTGDASAPVEFIASNGTFISLGDSFGFVATTLTMASMTTWTRLTITATSASPTVYRTYIQGKLVDTTNSGGNNTQMGFKSFINGWSWPVADIFLWNRTLDASAVAGHAADPYGTVLRPRLSNIGIKGTIAVGKKPSLLTTGVGP